MKRRAFIGLTAAGVAATAVAGPQPADPRDLFASPELIHVLGDRRLVAALGARYRETVPAEATVAALEAAIRAELGSSAEAVDGSLGSQLRARVRRDFDDGRTITLDGWVLAVTEARQCALHSLVAT